MIRLVRHNDILVARHADLDVHHRRDRVIGVVVALIDAHTAGDQALVDLFKALDVIEDLVFGPIYFFDVVESNFRLDLHCASSQRMSPAESTPGAYFGSRMERGDWTPEISQTGRGSACISGPSRKDRDRSG